MDSISLIRQQLGLAHFVLDVTMSDVTDEQMHWLPTGIATPLGASYAHVIMGEDMLISGFQQKLPLFATSWANRVGTSEPMPLPGPDWESYGPWTRSVHVNLEQMREYEKAVRASTDEYINSLSPADLDSELDLSGVGMGRQTLSWALSLLVIGHINNLAGEISCLKGLQGAKGYPF